MGQHKIPKLRENGKVQTADQYRCEMSDVPKPRKLSKRERDKLLTDKVMEMMMRPFTGGKGISYFDEIDYLPAGTMVPRRKDSE